ncbi:MAG: 30S ribosomal protein S6 [Desulfobacterales bacterium]|nr:30S ribosomal protein S6 [Desulfobacterales bacterium]
MMRRYETTFIVDPDLAQLDRDQLFKKIQELIPKHNGTIIEFEEWGLKKMAYEVKKKQRGYYVRIDYCGNPTFISEFERILRLDDKILKFMTIVLQQNANLMKIKEEMESKAQSAQDSSQLEKENNDTPLTDNKDDLSKYEPQSDDEE